MTYKRSLAYLVVILVYLPTMNSYLESGGTETENPTGAQLSTPESGHVPEK